MENLDPPSPPNQGWENGAFLPFARLHPWFGGDGGLLFHFILSKIVANRRSSAKVLMTEPDIDHAVKEILGAQVVYVFAFLHLARWISVRNNSEIKEKKRLFDQLVPCAFCLLEFTLQKILLAWKLWEQISVVWPSQNFYLGNKTRDEFT